MFANVGMVETTVFLYFPRLQAVTAGKTIFSVLTYIK